MPKNRIYLGEKLPVTISLYVGDIAVREVSYPVWTHRSSVLPRPESR